MGHPEAVVACELRSHGGKTEVLRLKRESDFFAGAEEIVALLAQDDSWGEWGSSRLSLRTTGGGALRGQDDG